MATFKKPSVGKSYLFESFNNWVGDNFLYFDEIGNSAPGETLFIVTDPSALVSSDKIAVFSLLSLEPVRVKCISYTPKVVVDPNVIHNEIVEDLHSEFKVWKSALEPTQRSLFDEAAKSTRTKVYFACPTGVKRDGICESFPGHFGACVTPKSFNRITVSKMNYFADNGCFAAFSRNEPFSPQKFVKLLEKIYIGSRLGEIKFPDFVVIPDIVGGGMKSLNYSMQWMKAIENFKIADFNYFLAIQDGMSMKAVEEIIKERKVDGLFLGGTKPWKYATGAAWSALAKKYSLAIHVGGIGVKSKIEWAQENEFTSVDSGVPMIHSKHLDDILAMEREYLDGEAV